MNSMDEMGMDFPQLITVSLCDRTVNTEVSGDFTLPDYQPELRRLLAVMPTPLPPAKYVESTGVELNGTVDYQVLYVGGDGGIYSVPLSSEYSLQVPLEPWGAVSMGEGVTVLVTPVCESVSTRVSAARRLNVRCRLRLRVCAYGKLAMEEQIRGSAEPESIRRLLAEGKSVGVWSGSSDPLAVSTELTGLGEGVRVIAASAEPILEESRMGEGMGSVSGELALKLLVEREGGGVETMTRRLPFEGEIELPDADGEGALRVTGTVSDLSVQVEEGRVICDAHLILEGRCLRNLPVRYTSDLYSTQRECECETEAYELPVLLGQVTGSLTQSERLPLSDLSLTEDAAIRDVWGYVRWEDAQAVDGKTVLTGQSRYYLLCEKEGDYSVAELELPLRYETEGWGAIRGCDACGNVLSCRGRIDGGTLSLDAEVAISAELWGRETVNPVTAVEFGEAVAGRGSGMTVYYPNGTETVWEVAKKYHVSPETLVEKQGVCSYYFF